jgi:hypothetical protein
MNYMIGHLCVLAALTILAPANGQEKGTFEQVPLDVWSITRQADVVVIARIKTAGPEIAAHVTRTLKGIIKTDAISFPCPPQPSYSERTRICPPPRFWKFLVGEEWLLFLKASETGYLLMNGTTGNVALFEQAVNDALVYDALKDESEKVRMVVAIYSRPPPCLTPSVSELEKLNTSTNYEAIKPLGKIAWFKPHYIELLRVNPNPEAEAELRGLLMSESGDKLCRVIDAFGRKNVNDVEASKILTPFLKNRDPAIRSMAVFILYYRDYRPVQRQIVQALDDPSPEVRRVALVWPWYAYAKENPEIRDKIKKMLSDPDAGVRESAKRALAGMSVWYRLWYFHR